MSFYSGCCRLYVLDNLTAFMAYHVVVPFHHACCPCGRLYDHWRPPYLHPAGCLRRVGHVGGPAVRGYDDLATRSAFVISVVILIFYTISFLLLCYSPLWLCYPPRRPTQP
ncbi:hypothetical protein GW17_00020789 [Ensete ventricosum]|nr:hypothetical protein GW17_00020789 [Ensete ventricosum]